MPEEPRSFGCAVPSDRDLRGRLWVLPLIPDGEPLVRYNSPLRYPGGKAGLAGFISKVIDLNDLRGCPYYEPYAGGAGVALSLLKQGVVSEVHLNDADPRLYAFWCAALDSSDRFVDCIRSVPLTVDEWHRQQSICANPGRYSQFETGFAAFFMNRCNRSGVLTGSGPIGGHGQAGKWRLDVRFNRAGLAERILTLRGLRDRVHTSCDDAVAFLRRELPRGIRRRHVFVYLDPPYVSNGQRLYLNAYKREDHAELAEYLDTQVVLPWIMSYDDSDLILDLYARHRIALMRIRYSLQKKRAAKELVIAPKHLAVPSDCLEPVPGRNTNTTDEVWRTL